VTLDGFVTGKAEVSAANQAKLARTVETIFRLLKQYPASKIHVIGYTDAVGQEADNQALGQSRADAVQSALHDLGLPDVALQADSRGAADLVVKTTRGEARNRRVEIRFETSAMGRHAMSTGLTLGSSQTSGGTSGGGGTPGGVVTDVTKVCEKDPALCTPPSRGDTFQPMADDTPYELMDAGGVSEAYTSRGDRPGSGGDLRATWKVLYDKYRYGWKLPKARAAQAANSELTKTAGKSEGRANPNAADRLDSDMYKANPNATTVGPGSIELFRF